MQALPQYFGGKRRLLPWIFKFIPPAREGSVFVDAFLGGGSVSLGAKLRGFKVICNDVAFRSLIIGKGIIENNGTFLTDADVAKFLCPGIPVGTVARDRLSTKDIIPPEHAEFVDNMLAVAGSTKEEQRKWLIIHLVIRLIMRCRPMGNFGARTITKQIAQQRWTEMNHRYLKDIIVRKIHLPPKAMADKLIQETNSGIFSNGYKNVANRMDAIEFLKGVSGDVVYFDPPYAGTVSYEAGFKPLDDLLAPYAPPFEGEDIGLNRFTSVAKWQDSLAAVFEAAAHLPLWVLSYGNAACTLEELTAFVGKFRKVIRAEKMDYMHLVGLASVESKKKNQEFLIVAEK